jgi:hypothetical protein
MEAYAKKTMDWTHHVLVNFQVEIENAKKRLAESAAMEQERVQLKKLIIMARFLTGILESPEALLKVEPQIVIQLLERLRWWLESRWPDAKLNIINEFGTEEFRLGSGTIYGFKMASLLNVAVEAIKRQLLLEEKNQKG